MHSEAAKVSSACAVHLHSIQLSYPLSDGKYIEKEGIRMGNEWISPYSPYLLKRFKCHINVEKCNNLNAIKYLYKYVYKGTYYLMH